jgi:hypothetical protein
VTKRGITSADQSARKGFCTGGLRVTISRGQLVEPFANITLAPPGRGRHVTTLNGT